MAESLKTQYPSPRPANAVYLPREVGGEAFIEGGEAGSKRAARGAAGAFNHLLRPRKADAPDFLVGERAGDDAFEVVGGVGAQDLLVRYRAWRRELSRAAGPIARDPLAQHRVLDHREPVAPPGRGSTKWSL